MIADDQLHESSNELLASADTILFGRVTYQLMERAWPSIVKKPTDIPHVDEFAVSIDQIFCAPDCLRKRIAVVYQHERQHGSQARQG